MLTRRQFLLAGAAGTAMCSLRVLLPSSKAATGLFEPAEAQAATELPEYTSWENLYREAWTWDRVVKGTHLRANCFSACAFDVYVKDGVVWREEQTNIYGKQKIRAPEFAPRGCQKGCSYSSMMTSPNRVPYPLARSGERGSGRWHRISWDDALTRIADAILDANVEGGKDTVIYDNGTSNVDWGPSSIGEMRLFDMLGATMLDGFGGTGDLAMGGVQTWGTSFVDGSATDWFETDTLVLWHCNPVSTRIPDAHFLTEARYRGTNVVTITPDYSPSAIHSSLWINPHPGSDAALALGAARSLLERGAVDEAYIREQTDLALLVRDDNQRFLRQSDLEDGGGEDIFYFAEQGSGRVVEATGCSGSGSGSLDLDGLVPSLSGRFQVKTLSGTVTARPVLDHVRERLAEYTPERVFEITGVGTGTQARFADLLAASPRTIFYASWGSNKAPHSDLLQRAIILLSALRGQHGRPASGVRFAAWFAFEGADDFLVRGRPSWLVQQVVRFLPPSPRTMEQAIRDATPTLGWTPSHLFLYVHGGLADAVRSGAQDATLPRSTCDYFEEAMERGWANVLPPADRPPRFLLTSGVNPLRRWPLPDVVERVLWPKLKLIVAVDHRLSSTGMKSDLILPAAGYYEKRGVKYAVALSPYVVVGDSAVAPHADSKPEWEIMASLALKIQERAIARGIGGELATFGDRFTEDGVYGPQDDEAVLDRILRNSSSTGGKGWEQLRREGGTRVASLGSWGTTNAIGAEFEEDGSFTPSRVHVRDKQAWPTLTGRQQFYLDHPWFFESDEVLPRWKPVPGAGGAYPLLLSGGHTRWSIHAIWRTEAKLLRLQRGEPSLWVSIEDAAARGIADGAVVRVRNDRGSFRIAARTSASVPRGEVILYHAWEPYQFADWKSEMTVILPPFKPTHLVGDYGHLHERVFETGPVHAPRLIPVEMELADPAAVLEHDLDHVPV